MTETIPLSIRPLNPEHEAAAFQRMFQEVYGHPISYDQWRWKYHAGPRTGAHSLVAQHQKTGEWLGHIGAVVLFGHQPQTPEIELHWAQIGDIMVVPHARGDLGSGGVYRQLIAHMQRLLASQYLVPGRSELFAYGFPGTRPFRLGERLGFYRRLGQCANHFYQPAGQAKSPALNKWSRWWHSAFGRIHLRQAAHWDEAILEQLWQHHAPSLDGPGVVKNAAYIRWRYQQHPTTSYTLWWCLHHAHPVGWLITIQEGDRQLLVVDSLLAPMHWPDAAQALVVHHPDLICRGWRPLPGSAVQKTPIVATEMRVAEYHPHWLSPQFQPGDTDVF